MSDCHEDECGRAADMHEPAEPAAWPRSPNDSAAWRKRGSPGARRYATPRGPWPRSPDDAAGGESGGTRIVAHRTLEYAIRNQTGDQVDEYMGMPMHRGLGPHLRGTTKKTSAGWEASPVSVFGHGGVGTSYCWGDPTPGVSFAYVTNNRIPDPWHSKRLDLVANLVHSAIL